MKIVETLYFTTRRGTVGLVIIEEDNTHDRKGYIGVVEGKSEVVDREELLAWGHKFSLSTAEDIARRLARPVVGYYCKGCKVIGEGVDGEIPEGWVLSNPDQYGSQDWLCPKCQKE